MSDVGSRGGDRIQETGDEGSKVTNMLKRGKDGGEEFQGVNCLAEGA